MGTLFASLRRLPPAIDRFGEHLARWYAAYFWAFVAVVAFGRYFILTINVSDSLPGSVFLVNKFAVPVKGDLAAFRYQGGGPYSEGVLFLKELVGVPGSVVAAVPGDNGRTLFVVDGRPVGEAKAFSKDRRPLAPGPTGAIPEGKFYVAGHSADSFDSRYQLVGWINGQQLVGTAVKLF